jgi:hypothetical protein
MKSNTLIPPLRAIFWGALICVLDIRFNGFDVLNDFPGTLLVTWGVFRLASIPVHPRYSKAMLFSKIMAVVACFTSLYDQFPHPEPQAVQLLLSILSIASLAAIIVFCVCMQWLSSRAGFGHSAKSWKTTTLLFSFIYFIPLGLTHWASILYTITGKQFHFDLGPAALILLPLFFLPLIHFFISTSRMKNEAESSGSITDLDVPTNTGAIDH